MCSPLKLVDLPTLKSVERYPGPRQELRPIPGGSVVGPLVGLVMTKYFVPPPEKFVP
jgi:hypothetical protein